MRMQNFFARIVTIILVLAIGIPCQAPAQTDQDDAPPPEQVAFRPEELDQMLAPIALYPDSLLAQVLMAATYPLEVVEATRFVAANRNLQGDQLLDAAKDKDWDPSVKSLLQFSDVLAMMDQQLEWTTDLGNAFLGQQRDVMDSVQRLRAKARETGNLESTPEQVVKVTGPQTIVIEPANPEVVYVPAYNPTVVYGTWWYPAYPPYVFYPPGYVVAAPFFFLTSAVILGAALWGAWDWHGHRCYVNAYNYNRFTRRTYSDYRRYGYNPKIRNPAWRHRPEHRKAVPYRDNFTARRYGQTRPSTMDRTRYYRGYDRPASQPDPARFQRELRERAPMAARPRPETGRPSVKEQPPRPQALDRQRPDTRTPGQAPRPVPPTVQRPAPDAGRQSVQGQAQRPPATVTPSPYAGRGPAGRPEPPAFSGMGSGGRESAASVRGQSSRSTSGGVSRPAAPVQPHQSTPGGSSFRGSGPVGGRSGGGGSSFGGGGRGGGGRTRGGSR